MSEPQSLADAPRLTDVVSLLDPYGALTAARAADDDAINSFLSFSLTTPDSIVQSIVEQFQERSRVGQQKYGVTLDRTDLSVFDWIEHAKQEMMDGILYLEKLKQTLQVRVSEKLK
jgi:hypothetical protein